MGTPHFCGNGFYRGFHDRHDVVIFWNRHTETPTNPSEIGILHNNCLRSEILAVETRHLQWGIFWCVKFKFVASPHVIFTAACTCSLAAGVKTQDEITVIKGKSSAKKLEFKTKITLRALEKRLRYCHRSSFAADPVHTLVLLGDWNIRASNFIEAAKDAKALAVDFTSEHSVMTARGTTERDHVACYYSRRHRFVNFRYCMCHASQPFITSPSFDAGSAMEGPAVFHFAFADLLRTPECVIETDGHIVQVQGPHHVHGFRHSAYAMAWFLFRRLGWCRQAQFQLPG